MMRLSTPDNLAHFFQYQAMSCEIDGTYLCRRQADGMVGESYAPDNSRSGDAQEEDPGDWWLVGTPERARPEV